MSLLEWVLRISSNEHELGMSYSVMFYLGDVPNPADDCPWAAPNCIAEHVSYTSPELVPPERDFAIRTHISMDSVLAKTFKEDELTPEVVVPHFRKNIRWMIQKMDTWASVVDTKDLPSLKVSLVRVVLDEEGNRMSQLKEYPLYPVLQ